MRRRLCTIAILAFAASVHAADDYSALFDEALSAVDWEFEQKWAYTETKLEEGELWVGRYDPRVDADDGWKLISVDGLTPTSRQVRNFLQDRDEHGGTSDKTVAAIVEPDSLDLIEETDEYWLFSFVPNENEESFIDSVDTSLKIIKDGRYISYIEMRNHSDIKPGFGTRLTSFLTQFSFAPAVDDGPIVPRGIKVKVVGRALLFIAIDETETIEYSDFEYVGD